jgi:hypothetical protein
LRIAFLHTKRGWLIRQPLATSCRIWLFSASPCCGCQCRCYHVNFDLLWLRFLTLRDARAQHPIFIVGLNRVLVHGVRQREASAEEPISAFDAQIVFLLNVLLKLALSADRKDIVLYLDVEILWIQMRQVCFNSQFMLGLENVDGWRPARQVRFFPRALQDIGKRSSVPVTYWAPNDSLLSFCPSTYARLMESCSFAGRSTRAFNLYGHFLLEHVTEAVPELFATRLHYRTSDRPSARP